MNSITKLDYYDTRVKYDDNGNIVRLEIDDLSNGDLVSITGELVSSNNHIYYDGLSATVKTFTTGLSTIKGQNILTLFF